MKKFYLIVFLCFYSYSYSQNTNWEKLKPIDSNFKDSIKINILIDNTWYHNIRDYNNSLPLLEEALDLATKINYKKGIGRANLAYSNYFYEKGDFQLANDYLLKARKILIQEKDLFYLKELFITQIHLDIYFKNYRKNFAQLLAYIDKETDPFLKARLYLLVADIYTSTKNKNFNKANDYLFLAKKEFSKANSPTGIHLSNLKQSRFYRNNIIFYKKNAFVDKSLEKANQSIIYFKQNNQKNNLAKAYKSKALIYSVVGKHKESIPFYDIALKTTNELGNVYNQMKINQHLFIAYSILNDHEKAVKANRLFVVLKDSLFSQEKHRLIIDAQTKFDTERIAAEKRLIEEKNKRSNSLLVASIIISFLLILSGLFLFGRYKAKKKVEISRMELEETKKRLALEKLYKNSELKALKSQMNPHFIFNVLNSIQEYILSNQKNLAGDYLGKFADLIRSYLHYSEIGEITIKEEVANLNLYLELEKLRFEDSLTYSITVKDAHLIDDYKIPTMIIQPYIENALNHGLLHKEENRLLKISIKAISSKIIECIVEDNGIGREKSKKIKTNRKNKHKSFALKATGERLKLLNTDKKEKIGVVIKDIIKNNKIEGTIVIITIPILEN